jgi:protein SEY1
VLALHAARAWDTIRQDRDLNLPAHRVLVANIRCEEIAQTLRTRHFTAEGSEWRALQAECRQPGAVVRDFGARAGSVLRRVLDEYRQEAQFFDRIVVQAKRADLVKAFAHEFAAPCIRSQARALQERQVARLAAALSAEADKHPLADASAASASSSLRAAADPLSASFSHLQLAKVAPRAVAECLDGFDAAAGALDLSAGFPEGGVSGDELEALAPLVQELAGLVAEARGELAAQAGAHVSRLTATLSAALTSLVRTVAFKHYLAPQVGALLDRGDPSVTWRGVRAALTETQEHAARALHEGLAALGASDEAAAQEAAALPALLRDGVRTQVAEAVDRAAAKMKERFFERFNFDEQGLPRAWGPGSDIPRAAREAKVAAAEVLATYAVLRWREAPGAQKKAAASTAAAGAGADGEQGSPQARRDVVCRSLCLLGDPTVSTAAGIEGIGSGADLCDVSTARTWPARLLESDLGCKEEDVVLSPERCRRVWAQFQADANVIIA